jgi:hypothetical protein
MFFTYYTQMNIVSEGMGSWGYGIIKPLLERTFPKTALTFDNSKPPTLVVRSHYANQERYLRYSCPYILWSAESIDVPYKSGRSPILEINTVKTSRPNSLWFPHLVTEVPYTVRPDPNPAKTRCCAYAFSHSVGERERFFQAMRRQEPTCFAFGKSCFTADNPFELQKQNRFDNSKAFGEFGFCVAMENTIAPHYITEKIGNAFCSGSVPIYRGDSSAINEFFNPESLIDVSNFASPEVAADYAIQVWRDPHKLQKYLDAPIRTNTRLADYEAVYTEYRPWQKPFVDTLRDAFPDF